MQKKLNIGILTFHDTYNYGAILQTYALCQSLMNHNIKVIDYNSKSISDKKSHNIYNKNRSISYNIKHFVNYYILRRGRKKEKKFNHFLADKIPLTKQKVTCLSQLNENFDLVIVGSDQVWNPTFTSNKLDPNYFLSNIKSDCVKISYAASAGSYIFNKYEVKLLEEYLDLFQAISVRENSLKIQLNKYFRKEIDVVLDPTFLLTKSQWSNLSSNINPIKRKYLLVYTFDNNSLCFNLAKIVADHLDLIIVAINSKLMKPKQVNIQKKNCSPIEFIDLFFHADFVITNSFHGTAFAINFEKNFYAINKENNPDRVNNLLKMFNLKSRLITKTNDFDKNNLTIEYTEIIKSLDIERANSEQYLLNSIRKSFNKIDAL